MRGTLDRLVRLTEEMSDESTFVKSIMASPHEQMNWLVFADWLSDHNREREAGVLRALAPYIHPSADLPQAAAAVAPLFGHQPPKNGPQRRALGALLARAVPWMRTYYANNLEWHAFFQRGFYLPEFAAALPPFDDPWSEKVTNTGVTFGNWARMRSSDGQLVDVHVTIVVSDTEPSDVQIRASYGPPWAEEEAEEMAVWAYRQAYEKCQLLWPDGSPV